MDEVLVFDLYGTLVDPMAVAADLSDALGAGGTEVSRLWRMKQLEYTFRLTAMELYEDFSAVTAHALEFALAASGLTLPDPLLRDLASRYDHLPAFPDAGPALRQLSGLGFELAVLSNGTPGMIRGCLDSSGLHIIGQALSVHAVRAYKPSPRVYQFAASQLGRPAGQLRLVSGNAFDIAGAGAAGLRTAWINRAAVPFDTIGRPPEIAVSSLEDLPAALCSGAG